jgi:hypothetical protein
METTAGRPARGSTPGGGWEQEIVAIHARRAGVPRDTWRDLFAGARREIGVLVYAGAFLAEDDELMQVLAARAAAGVRVRVLLGDADSPQVALRGDEEGIDGAMAVMARSALARHRALLEPRGAQIRLHDTVLYTSLYLADGQLLVNQHVFGVAAADAPVMHLRRRDGGQFFGTYLDAFERVWSGAAPLAADGAQPGETSSSADAVG